MSIDGLMPPNSGNMIGMIRRLSAYEVFAQHSRTLPSCRANSSPTWQSPGDPSLRPLNLCLEEKQGHKLRYANRHSSRVRKEILAQSQVISTWMPIRVFCALEPNQTSGPEAESPEDGL